MEIIQCFNNYSPKYSVYKRSRNAEIIDRCGDKIAGQLTIDIVADGTKFCVVVPDVYDTIGTKRRGNPGKKTCYDILADKYGAVCFY